MRLIQVVTYWSAESYAVVGLLSIVRSTVLASAVGQDYTAGPTKGRRDLRVAFAASAKATISVFITTTAFSFLVVEVSSPNDGLSQMASVVATKGLAVVLVFIGSSSSASILAVLQPSSRMDGSTTSDRR